MELVCVDPTDDENDTTLQTVKLSPRQGSGQARRGAPIDYAALVAAWNDHCGALPRVSALNEQRRRAFKRLVAEHGYDEALSLLIDATKQVARDEFWLERGYGLDNLIRPGRVVEKAEKYRAAPKKLNAAELRMAKNAATIARAIGGW